MRYNRRNDKGKRPDPIPRGRSPNYDPGYDTDDSVWTLCTEPEELNRNRGRSYRRTNPRYNARSRSYSPPRNSRATRSFSPSSDTFPLTPSPERHVTFEDENSFDRYPPIGRESRFSAPEAPRKRRHEEPVILSSVQQIKVDFHSMWNQKEITWFSTAWAFGPHFLFTAKSSLSYTDADGVEYRVKRVSIARPENLEGPEDIVLGKFFESSNCDVAILECSQYEFKPLEMYSLDKGHGNNLSLAEGKFLNEFPRLYDGDLGYTPFPHTPFVRRFQAKPSNPFRVGISCGQAVLRSDGKCVGMRIATGPATGHIVGATDFLTIQGLLAVLVECTTTLDYAFWGIRWFDGTFVAKDFVVHRERNDNSDRSHARKRRRVYSDDEDDDDHSVGFGCFS